MMVMKVKEAFLEQQDVPVYLSSRDLLDSTRRVKSLRRAGRIEAAARRERLSTRVSETATGTWCQEMKPFPIGKPSHRDTEFVLGWVSGGLKGRKRARQPKSGSELWIILCASELHGQGNCCRWSASCRFELVNLLMWAGHIGFTAASESVLTRSLCLRGFVDAP